MVKQTKAVRCTSLVQRYIRHLFRNSAQDVEEQSIKRPRKGGSLQLTRQGSPTIGQAVRIASARREESLWQSIVTWVQWSTKKKERSPNTGGCSRKYAVFAEKFWHSEGLDAETKSLDGRSSEANETTLVGPSRCSHESRRFQEKLVVMKQGYVHRGARRRNIQLQIPRREWSVD